MPLFMDIHHMDGGVVDDAGYPDDALDDTGGGAGYSVVGVGDGVHDDLNGVDDGLDDMDGDVEGDGLHDVGDGVEGAGHEVGEPAVTGRVGTGQRVVVDVGERVGGGRVGHGIR